MPPKSSFLCGCRALGCDVFCMVLVVRGCTYQQPARVPACPVVPILNTCQQKLSSPTCFKHQTCNYEVFQKAHFKLLCRSNISQTELIWKNRHKVHQKSSNVPLSGPDDVLRAALGPLSLSQRTKTGRAQVHGAHSLVGMSNGCKAQQRPDKRPRRPGAFIARPARVAPISCPPSRLIAPRLFSTSFAGIPTIHEENTRGMF